MANEVLLPGMYLRNGIYCVRKMVNGERRKASTGKRDYKSACRRYHEIMKEWNDESSGWTNTKVMTFGAYWEKYRAARTLTKTPLKNGTYRDDQLVSRFMGEFKHKPLKGIRPSDAEGFINKRRNSTYTIHGQDGSIRAVRKTQPGTVVREASFLHAVFQQAIKDGYIHQNPFAGTDRKNYRTRDRVLSHREQELLLAQLTPRYQRWVLFMLGTGLRLEEARSVNPKTDLNLERRTLRVTRKTKGLQKKVQEVPLFDDDVIEVIKTQLAEDGDWWTANQQHFRAILQKAADRAGIPHVSPHCFRHTFATRYLQAGGDIYNLSLILGHASVGVTEKVYAHLRQEDLLRASRGIRMGLSQAVPAKVIEFKKEA